MHVNDLINVRTIEQEDINFILSSSIKCLLSYRKRAFMGWEYDDIVDYLRELIIFSITKLNYSVLIACDRSNSSDIFGYIVADTNSNHILLQYTKYLYRDRGIQKNLLLPLLVDIDSEVTMQFYTKHIERFMGRRRVRVLDRVFSVAIQKLQGSANES